LFQDDENDGVQSRRRALSFDWEATSSSQQSGRQAGTTMGIEHQRQQPQGHTRGPKAYLCGVFGLSLG
jgi:hypothetical protein